MAGRPREPRTREELQAAVDAAAGALALESARAYGLVRGGPEVNVERCLAILARGRRRGVFPAPDAIERFVGELLAGDAEGMERPR